MKIQKVNGGVYIYKSSEYNTWIQMRKRCYKTNNKDYHNYGARGITVCEEWKNSFETFLLDMGTRPSKGHSLDRIKNNEGYSKENCRWATKKEQAINRRRTVLFQYNDNIFTMEGLASIFKTTRDKVKYYLRKGETVQQLEKRFGI